MSKFSKAMRATNTVASLLIAIGVAVDLYEKFKGRKKTPTLVRPKDMIERLEENISEQLRLMTAVEYFIIR